MNRADTSEPGSIPTVPDASGHVDLACSEVRVLVDHADALSDVLHHVASCGSCRSYAAEVTCD